MTPQYFVVRTKAGKLVGVWEDEQVAGDILRETPGGRMHRLIDIDEASICRNIRQK